MENEILNIESSQVGEENDAQALLGTPEESENQENYRVFKTQEEFQKCIDKALGKRLSKMREQQEELNKLRSLKERLFEAYGSDNIDEISFDVLENVQKEEKEIFSQSEVENTLQTLAESNEIYGALSPETLLQNERFTALLENGFSVKDAFDAVNVDLLLKEREEKVRGAVIREIRTRGMRPSESALSGYGSFSAGLNPKNLSDAQRAEIRERVRRGEKITF